ncbi:hypothetical protein C900_01480 [Fulvivirga imtechensis AK7]|uniref:Uncharacterized protein n=2 Tax=Fulvivirga TaxID=396811 RepID=L8JUL9_9BACT|nr:hypothetical protein C900_01480 [Fulvivirga imtechensis AK7]
MDKQKLEIHSHFGTHDGQEHGLICKECNDGIMGRHPEANRSGVVEYV